MLLRLSGLLKFFLDCSKNPLDSLMCGGGFSATLWFPLFTVHHISPSSSDSLWLYLLLRPLVGYKPRAAQRSYVLLFHLSHSLVLSQARITALLCLLAVNLCLILTAGWVQPMFPTILMFYSEIYFFLFSVNSLLQKTLSLESLGGREK